MERTKSYILPWPRTEDLCALYQRQPWDLSVASADMRRGFRPASSTQAHNSWIHWRTGSWATCSAHLSSSCCSDSESFPKREYPKMLIYVCKSRLSQLSRFAHRHGLPRFCFGITDQGKLTDWLPAVFPIHHAHDGWLWIEQPGRTRFGSAPSRSCLDRLTNVDLVAPCRSNEHSCKGLQTKQRWRFAPRWKRRKERKEGCCDCFAPKDWLDWARWNPWGPWGPIAMKMMRKASPRIFVLLSIDPPGSSPLHLRNWIEASCLLPPPRCTNLGSTHAQIHAPLAQRIFPTVAVQLLSAFPSSSILTCEHVLHHKSNHNKPPITI